MASNLSCCDLELVSAQQVLVFIVCSQSSCIAVIACAHEAHQDVAHLVLCPLQ